MALLPHGFSSCSTPVVQGIIPDNFDSTRLKLARAAGEQHLSDALMDGEPGKQLCWSHLPLPLQLPDQTLIAMWAGAPLRLSTFVGFLRFCSSVCNNISVWRSPKVSVADSRHDSIDVLVGEISPGPQNHIKSWFVGLQLRPIDILFTQAWANISEHRDTSWRSRVSQDEEFTYNNGGKGFYIPPPSRKHNPTPLDACDQYQQRFMIPVGKVIFHRGKLLFVIVRKKRKKHN